MPPRSCTPFTDERYHGCGPNVTPVLDSPPPTRMDYEPGMPHDDARSQTSFTRMTDATKEDFAVIARHSFAFTRHLPDRILAHLGVLVGDTAGYAVDRLQHSLQTATP